MGDDLWLADSGNVGMAPATATSPALPVLTLVYPAEAYPVVVLLLDGLVCVRWVAIPLQLLALLLLVLRPVDKR